MHPTYIVISHCLHRMYNISVLFPFLSGQSEGNTVGLNLREPLYVGGVDVEKVRIAPGVEVDTGFQGCVSEVWILYTACFRAHNNGISSLKSGP